MIRLLWSGGNQESSWPLLHRRDARLFTLPEKLIRIYVAADGKRMAELAREIGDGLITAGDEGVAVKAFDASDGKERPKYAQLTVCWARTEKDAVRVAHRQWSISALAWPVLSELPIPQYFEESTTNVTEDQIAETIVCGPSARKHSGKIERY